MLCAMVLQEGIQIKLNGWFQSQLASPVKVFPLPRVSLQPQHMHAKKLQFSL